MDTSVKSQAIKRGALLSNDYPGSITSMFKPGSSLNEYVELTYPIMVLNVEPKEITVIGANGVIGVMVKEWLVSDIMRGFCERLDEP